MATGSPQQRNTATCKRTMGPSSQSPGLRWRIIFRLQYRVGHSPRSFATDVCRPRTPPVEEVTYSIEGVPEGSFAWQP